MWFAEYSFLCFRSFSSTHSLFICLKSNRFLIHQEFLFFSFFACFEQFIVENNNLHNFTRREEHLLISLSLFTLCLTRSVVLVRDESVKVGVFEAKLSSERRRKRQRRRRRKKVRRRRRRKRRNEEEQEKKKE